MVRSAAVVGFAAACAYAWCLRVLLFCSISVWPASVTKIAQGNDMTKQVTKRHIFAGIDPSSTMPSDGKLGSNAMHPLEKKKKAVSLSVPIGFQLGLSSFSDHLRRCFIASSFFCEI